MEGRRQPTGRCLGDLQRLGVEVSEAVVTAEPVAPPDIVDMFERRPEPVRQILGGNVQGQENERLRGHRRLAGGAFVSTSGTRSMTIWGCSVSSGSMP